MADKQTCFMCYGNGFRTVHEDTTRTNVVLIQCSNCNRNGSVFTLDQKTHDKLKAEFERYYKPHLPTLADYVKQRKEKRKQRKGKRKSLFSRIMTWCFS
jgi:hypothetical protein